MTQISSYTMELKSNPSTMERVKKDLAPTECPETLKDLSWACSAQLKK